MGRRPQKQKGEDKRRAYQKKVDKSFARLKRFFPPIPTVKNTEHKNVVSIPTKPNGEQGWRCVVCEAELHYQQPINMRKCMELIGKFLSEHQHPIASESIIN